MTAAAGVYLLNGNIDAIEAAASLVLANMLGLTCDPVMGRVEVPCILRNGTTVGLTFTAIEMALDNVRYSIPFDEVVDVMKKVGEDMHTAYKETSQGGLAKTETARLLCQNCPGCG
jgi:L-serine dehydratase